jgi:rhamnosyltransferase
MKIGAVVIVYHPEDDAIANIKTYYDSVDKIYVFDNTERVIPGFKEKLQQFPKIVFFHDGSNKGIARRLNDAAESAIKDGFDWLLTMDQDTTFSNNAITFYLQCAQEYAGKEKVAVFGTRYGRKYEESYAKCAAESTDTAITSGSLLNLASFHAIGKFDENLFIDLVDNEYCIRAAMKGYSIIRFNNIHIVHTIGMLVKRAAIKTLFLVKKERQVHSPIRCYYTYRNMLYLEAKYKNDNPAFAAYIRPYAMGFLKRNIYYARNAWTIIKYLMVAKRDFLNGKMGKIAQQL